MVKFRTNSLTYLVRFGLGVISALFGKGGSVQRIALSTQSGMITSSHHNSTKENQEFFSLRELQAGATQKC